MVGGTARLALTAISSIQPAIGATRCDLAILPLRRRQPPQIYDGYQSTFLRRYRWIFSTGSRFTSSTPCLIGQGCLAVAYGYCAKSDGSAACSIGTAQPPDTGYPAFFGYEA